MWPQYTCSFAVSCGNEALVKFFCKAHPGQLSTMEPYEKQPIAVLSIAVLT